MKVTRQSNHDRITLMLTHAIAEALEGADWAPTEYGTQMIEAVWDQTVVAPIFPRIPMPRSPYVLPFSLTGGTVYLAGEATSDTPSDYTASTPATAAASRSSRASSRRRNSPCSSMARPRSGVICPRRIARSLLPAFALDQSAAWPMSRS
jgi:hypothetical protein